MIEFGVFNDEGCVESGLWSFALAEQARDAHRAAGDSEAYAAEMCPEHEEEPRESCEECNTEDDDEEA
jgi:hypothetical protein